MRHRAPARSHLHRTTTLIAFLAVLTLVPDGTAIAQPPPPHSATETFDTTDRMDGDLTTADWDTVRGVASLAMETTHLATAATITTCLDVCVAGNLTLATTRTGGLALFDTTDPLAPAFLGSYQAADVRFVAMDGDHAVISTRGVFPNPPLGFWVILDISDPTNPVSVGVPPFWNEVANEIVIAGDLLLMPSGSNGLAVVDITQVTAPDVQPRYNTDGTILGADVQGRYAYTVGSVNFEVLDISDPGAVARVGYLPLANGSQVAVDGLRAYVVTSDDELRVVDISDPTSPAQVAAVPLADAQDVCLGGDWAYVAAGDFGLIPVDISDPAAPLPLAPVNTGGFANRCKLAGNVVHVANGAAGYSTFRVADLVTAPELVASYDIVNDASCVAVAGNLAVVTEHGPVGYEPGRLWILDVSDPEAPSALGVYNGFALGYKPVAVALAGDRAFVVTTVEVGSGSYRSTMHTIDISNPAYPVQTDFMSFVDYTKVQSLTLRGNYAYCGCATSSASWGVIIFDVGDPDNLAIAGHVSTPDRDVSDVVLVDNAMYVAEPRGAYNQHLQVFDATDPAAPVLAWHGNMGYGFDDLGISGEHLCVTASTFSVYDLAVPLAPTFESWINSTGQYRCLEPVGRYVAVDIDAGFGMVDFHDPASPVQLAQTGHAGHLGNIVVAGDYAYGASSDVAPGSYSGLMVFKVFEHAPDMGGVEVASTSLNPPTGNEVRVARISTVETGAAFWYLTADGSHYQRFYPGAALTTFAYPGTDLRWLAYLHPTAAVPWPSIDEVTVEWYESDVSAVDAPAPDRFSLGGGTPNPFNAETRIVYDVPGGGGEVTLVIYDLRGRLVRRLVEGFQAEGRRQAAWDGRDSQGRRLAAGVYYCRLIADGCDETRKVTLVP